MASCTVKWLFVLAGLQEEEGEEEEGFPILVTPPTAATAATAAAVPLLLPSLPTYSTNLFPLEEGGEGGREGP